MIQRHFKWWQRWRYFLLKLRNFFLKGFILVCPWHKDFGLFFCEVLNKNWRRNLCWDRSRWLKAPLGNHFFVANRTLWVQSWSVWMKMVEELCRLSNKDPWLGANWFSSPTAQGKRRLYLVGELEQGKCLSLLGVIKIFL